MAQTIRQFWKDLSELVDAGIPLMTSLDLIIGDAGNENFTGVLKEVITEVKGGSLFSDALSKNQKFFGPVEINLVRAGEVGGMLEVSIARLASLVPIKADEYRNFYEVFGNCLRSGVPVLTSLKSAKEYCSGDLEKFVEKLIEAIKVGDSLSPVMKDSGLFCAGEIALINVGEETGSLDGVLYRLAKSC